MLFWQAAAIGRKFGLFQPWLLVYNMLRFALKKLEFSGDLSGQGL